MPWDSIDRWRDEDDTERRKEGRRQRNRAQGRRSIDHGLPRAAALLLRRVNRWIDRRAI